MKDACSAAKIHPLFYYAIAGVGVAVSFFMALASLFHAQYTVLGCCGYGAFLLTAVMVSGMLAARYKFYRKYEVVFLMVAAFCVAWFFIYFLAGLGRVCTGGIDAYKAQMALESGKICSFHPQRYVYWYNWNVLLSVLGLVFSKNLIVGQLFNALSLSFALFPIFKISEMISGRAMARFAAIAFAFNPVVVLYSTVLTSEYWSAAFVAWSCYLIMRCRHGESSAFGLMFIGAVLFAGIMLGVADFFKSISIIFKAAILTVILLEFLMFRGCRRVILSLILLVCISYIGSFVASTGHRCAIALASEKPQVTTRDTSIGNVMAHEFVLGLNLKTNGTYDRELACKMLKGGPDVRKKLLKEAVRRDWKEYPALMVRKFINLHGSSCSTGSAMSEIRHAFRGATDDLRKKGREMPLFLVELAENSLVVFRILFFVAVAGCLFADKGNGLYVWRMLPLIIVLGFMSLEQLIECHGRYKAAIYPFFFLVLPFASDWKLPLSKLSKVMPILVGRACGLKTILINRFRRGSLT